MNHLWRGKVFTIPGPVLNNGGLDIGGAQFMPVPSSKNRDAPFLTLACPMPGLVGTL